MAPSQKTMLAPLATVLPDLPAGEVLTADEWTTLLAVAETVIPSIHRASASAVAPSAHLDLVDTEYDALVLRLADGVNAPSAPHVVEDYLAEGATTYDAFQRELRRTFALCIRQDAQKQMAFILRMMNTRVGSIFLTGSSVPFHQRSVSDRMAILTRWSRSYLPPLRMAQAALARLTKAVWVRTSPTMGPMLGFPRNPAHGTPGQGFDFDFIQFGPGSDPAVLEADVVVVGSGCGAAVTAKNLADDGHRVIVLEKGLYYPAEYLPMTELAGAYLLFEGGGFQPSDDSSILVMAGATWGGGGTVNWSASLQTQAFVRQEWADDGLPFFASADFQASLDRVCHRMGVATDKIEHNHGNHVLLEGARRLGYSAKVVPQNTGGRQHACGYCTLGCGAAEKQGPVVSWLPDAARAGARFVEGCTVEKVIFDERVPSKVAVGVRGRWRSRDGQVVREVVIRARKTVLSAGTLWSPLILQRSGLKNAQIGRNLKLHPAGFVFGVWPTEIRPWEGSILTAVCDEFQNLDGRGHGCKLECLSMMPAGGISLLPGLGPEAKALAVQFKRMCGFVSIVRDQGSGRVYADADGKLRFAYSASAVDRAHCLEGMIALAKLCYVMGAAEIWALNGTAPYIRSERERSDDDGADDDGEDGDGGDTDAGVNHPAFAAWLAQVRAGGVTSPEMPLASAHQMGTCRMGASEQTSVVDDRGRVWATENLYVADASVFPSASGVNPMITNMAIADWISRGLAKQLRRESKPPANL
ncbi:MAG: hypothetical protein M1826_003140 [Phylliscum demangeonii]|nr:MAG: hypothetical protein M1826_003140 [Phylliscum demangeonii]